MPSYSVQREHESVLFAVVVATHRATRPAARFPFEDSPRIVGHSSERHTPMTTPTSLDARAPRAEAPADTIGFAELGVPAPVVSALDARGITSAFPIQAATLPDSLAGRDVIGRGRTGSGKTVAFSIPTVVTLAASGSRQARRPRGLVLVPTRELAAQVAETLAPLAAALGLRTTTIFGGVGMQPQINALANGVDIVVACPGRLEDLIQQRKCSLDAVQVTVLDEADHMADLGFLPGVKRIMDQTPRQGQRLLFSATLDNGVDVLVKRYLTDPVVHSVDSAESPVPDMVHHVLHVAGGDKAAVVHTLSGGAGRTLLFTRTKHAAKKLALQLSKAGIPSVDLHGNLSQNARTRNLEMFTTGEARVLVATDIAARGIHVDDITLVVHVDPPAEHKAYLHRSGRTARAGASGTVVTVVTPDQKRDVDDLTRKAGIRPRYAKVDGAHPLLRELTGPAAPLVEMKAPRPALEQRGSGAGRPGSRGDGQASRGARQGDGGRAGRPSNGRPGAPAGGSRPGGASGRPARRGGSQPAGRSASRSR